MNIPAHLLAHFGLPANPFAVANYQTADSVRVRQAVAAAVLGRELLVVSGRRGYGKSRAVEAALHHLAGPGKTAPRIIRPSRVEAEYLRSGDLVAAAILDLSTESPRARRELRTRQLARILGEAAKKGPVVLLVEEAHLLHPSTLLTMKRLRELSWEGVFPLLSILLIGQQNPLLCHRGLDEVRLRSSHLPMAGLSREEMVAILDELLPGIMPPEAVQAAADAGAPGWLDLQALVGAAMARAAAKGLTQIGREEILAAEPEALSIGGSGRRNFQLEMKMLGLVGKDVAAGVGLGLSETLRALNQNPGASQRSIRSVGSFLDSVRTGREQVA